MAEKILIVEDDPTLQETLAYNLKRQGYEVDTAEDGKTALDLAAKSNPDLVVLDIMLPVLDGLEVCRILRKNSNVPILMLTARDDEIDRVLGLELGADDYLTKPFSMREFLARVKAQFRRVRFDREDVDTQVPISSEIITFENLSIDLARHEISIDGKPLNLKPKEFELMEYLARHKGQVLSRELILDQVWGWDFTGGSRTVDVHIRWLREKIEADPANPDRIITVRGAGYRFEG
ncbi:MAG: response regulator transcription factor [Anaerolineales bacterium]